MKRVLSALVAVLSLAATANAGVDYSRDQLVQLDSNSNATVYLIKGTKAAKPDGTLEFKSLIQYTDSGQKTMFPKVAKAKRPVVQVMQMRAKCEARELKTVSIESFSLMKDLGKQKMKSGWEAADANTLPGTLLDGACYNPDFQ